MMQMDFGFLSVVPSLLAIVLALYTRNVLLSLFGGILLGIFVLTEFHFISSLHKLWELFATLLTTPWILKTLAFAVLVGSIIELLERSGGIEGFVNAISQRSRIVNSPRKALLVSYLIGIFIFIESSITSLIAGAVGRPLCDREGVSHAKLAFVCDATSAPVSSLIALNGWGALLLGLIATQIDAGYIQSDAVATLLHSLAFNLYSIVMLLIVFLFIWFDFSIGPMKHATPPPPPSSLSAKKESHMLYMLLPILFMIASVFLFLYITGDGDIFKGSSSSSIFYTTLATLALMFLLYVPTKKLSMKEYIFGVFKGGKKLFGIALVLLFAFAIGKVTNELQTGLYLASLAKHSLSPLAIGAVVFLLSAIIAFSTGTSWGTFSIMIPIAVPMATSLESSIPLAIGAVISGGVFGDHCSPISDTTIISSLAADCDLVEHVKTQLPYALIAAAVTTVLFILLSIF